MRRDTSKSSQLRRRQPRNERGVALITTLLLLMLLTGLSLAMVFSVRSDMLINGYYRNFRGSFYAADSGLNAARTAMVDGVVAAIPASFGITQQPIPPGTDGAIQTMIQNTYGQNFTKFTGQGSAASSWPGSYKVTGTFLLDPLVGCTVLGGGGTCAAPTGPVTGYKYIYNYTLQSIGQAQGTQSTTLTDRGSVTVNATLVPVNSKTSFAAWGMFIDQWNVCTGGTLVPGTISGPAFTNGAWTFGTGGNYIFTDTVGSGSPTAGFSFNSGCDSVGAVSDKKGNQTIAPTFQAGFNMGQPSVPLPPNDYNQEQAVLDGKGVASNPVTKSDLHSAVKDVHGNSYPSSGASSGVFLPYSIQDGTPTFTGGGIYIEGNSTVVLSTATGPNGSAQQIYQIKQGSPAVTTTVTVDPGNNVTTVVSGGSTLNITGFPKIIDPVTNTSSPATMLYDNGSITSLSGPGQGLPAIQNGSDVTITAASNVAITGDVLYTTEPVTQTQNQIPGQPADTLIPGNDTHQALGIFTATGDIQLNNKQANGNLEIDASLATISANGTGGLTNIGNPINTLTIVGGRIQNQIKNINTTTRNVFFDRRFAQNGFAPPWFPSTTISPGSLTGAHATTTVTRVQWLNQSSYF
ncbi:MAG TPA: PilX N-terminal domain-containing pilus assembly protein [Candidatus Angelobacter sp.]